MTKAMRLAVLIGMGLLAAGMLAQTSAADKPESRQARQQRRRRPQASG